MSYLPLRYDVCQEINGGISTRRSRKTRGEAAKGTLLRIKPLLPSETPHIHCSAFMIGLPTPRWWYGGCRAAAGEPLLRRVLSLTSRTESSPRASAHWILTSILQDSLDINSAEGSPPMTHGWLGLLRWWDRRVRMVSSIQASLI
jgi:hypothetical protein